ncbi:MAG TPA: hypothetical protein VF457_00520 [Burkholderiaceae bacterium]
MSHWGMPVYEIKPVFIDGMSAAAEWVDDAHSAWNEPLLRTTARLARRWTPPVLELYRSEARPTAVLFHPTVHLVSQGVRDELSHFPEIEFLPVHVAGYGTFHALHVLASCELPAGSEVDRGPGTDIALIRAFPRGFEAPAPFFRIRHPGAVGADGTAVCVPDVYAGEAAAAAVQQVAGRFLRAVRVPYARAA